MGSSRPSLGVTSLPTAELAVFIPPKGHAIHFFSSVNEADFRRKGEG